MANYIYRNIPSSLITESPSEQLRLSICIPCYNEQDISSTILSLLACQSIEGQVEVIILINESSEDKSSITAQNLSSYEECERLYDACRAKGIALYPIIVSQITPKKAGVGYARRLSMDEACRRFNTIENERGIIVCLDADSIVSSNYLVELIRFFNPNQGLSACSIAFAHNLDIVQDEKIKNAICDYESHLRYFVNMQRLINLPFAYQTVGSAMAVTAKSYHKHGGMNTRKAGEDFYFLHKFIKNDLVGELNTACVYPSSRVSDRVPFGTGKAVGDIVGSLQSYKTYDPRSFAEIDKLVRSLPDIYTQGQASEFALSNFSDTLREYLISVNFKDKIVEIKSNTTDYVSFRKRFFQWFDAFRLMKCLHFMRDHYYSNIEVADAMKTLFVKLDLSWKDNKYENLITLRTYDNSYLNKN